MLSTHTHSIRVFAICCTLFSAVPRARADDDIYAVQSRASTPNFQLFLNLADDGSVAMSGPLFGPTGGVYGLTSLDGTIYAAELDGGGSDEYLATIPHDSPFGDGDRVSASPIGFPSVESLAAADGMLYATSIDFSAHMTTLITIDPSTGIGSAIGTGDFDVIIVGLAFDPMGDVLYGAGIPFGATGVDTPNLYALDRTTGDTTLVGDMGVELQSLTWDPDLGLIGAFDHLYEIDTATGAATQIGTTDFTDGIPDMFNGIYSLAAIVTATSLDGDYNDDGVVNAADYVVWRNNELSSVTLPNDTTPGSVTEADYDVWVANFGAGGGLGATAAIPEPGTAVLTVIAALVGVFPLAGRQR